MQLFLLLFCNLAVKLPRTVMLKCEELARAHTCIYIHDCKSIRTSEGWVWPVGWGWRKGVSLF